VHVISGFTIVMAPGGSSKARQAIDIIGGTSAPCGAWRQGSAPPGGVGKTMALEEHWRLAAGRYRQAV